MPPSAPSRRRSDTAGTTVWVCEPQRQESARAATLPFWDLPEDWEYIWASAPWRGAVPPHAASSVLTLPPPNPLALLHREAAPGSYRSARRLQRQLSDQRSWRQRQKLCVWEWLEGRRPQTLPVRPPPCGSGAAPETWAPGRHRKAPAAGRATRRGLPTWPGPATAATSRHPAPDSGCFAPPSRPTPSPRDSQRLPGRALPFFADRERGTWSPARKARRSQALSLARNGVPLLRRPEGTHSGWGSSDPHNSF